MTTFEEYENTEINEQEAEELADAEVVKIRKKGGFAKKLFVVIALCFCAYAAFTIIYDKAEIAKLRSEKTEISKQIDEEKALNDEYNKMLESGEKEYMKKIAIDKLGYAFPEERRFYIVNQNK
ncbi:MAG: hypothetical protein IKH90_07675 [Ruminococcus sp.]|nr:hypothetical protein [Ruminococcus sp.]